MTAMSAQRASEPTASASNASPIRLPGSERTYEVRDVLRGMGLRWDPATHAWHGRLAQDRRALLAQRFGLVPQVVVPIETFQTPASGRVMSPKPPAGPRGPVRDYSRTRLEGHVALGREEDPDDEIQTLSLIHI